jgi:hypothetical protein
MINVYTRQQFSEYWEEIKPGLGHSDSVLWAAEHSLRPDTCQHFVCVPPLTDLQTIDQSYSEFWAWCEQQMQGYCRCFSSNTRDREEWWGFTNKDDILMWVLRWIQ